MTNGDVFSWRNVWPSIAAAFGMEAGDPAPISFAEWMPRQASAWERLVARHRLRAPTDIMAFVGMNSLVYADMLLREAPGPRTPILNSTIKIRQAGFAECMDTEDMFVAVVHPAAGIGLAPRGRRLSEGRVRSRRRRDGDMVEVVTVASDRSPVIPM